MRNEQHSVHDGVGHYSALCAAAAGHNIEMRRQISVNVQVERMRSACAPDGRPKWLKRSGQPSLSTSMKNYLTRKRRSKRSYRLIQGEHNEQRA